MQRYLAGAGIASTAVDLPGSGADTTPRGNVSLIDYIDAIVAAIDEIDDDVLVVGHSIAGLSVAAAAVARPERVRGVLLIAALVVNGGARGIDSIPEDRRPGYFEMAKASPDNTLLPDFESAWRRFFPSLEENRAVEFYAQLTPQPLRVYLDPNPVSWHELHMPIAYVVLEQDVTFPVSLANEFAQRANARVWIRSGDHCWMLTDPAACADAIGDFALDLRRG